MPYVRLSNGSRLYYEDQGPKDGKVVIAIHGWCATCRLFSEQIDALVKAGYRVVAFDSAGHGRSSKQVEEFSFRDLMARLEEFLEKLDLLDKPLAVMGHSAGGGVAQFFYLRHPDQVKALVLLQTGYRMRDSLPRMVFWSFGPLYARIFFNPLVKTLLFPAVITAADLFAIAVNSKRSLSRQWFRDIFRTPPHVAANEIREILKMDIEGVLPKVEAPVCIIGSRFDVLAPARQSVRMHELMTHSELHILNKSGHIGKITEADRTNAIIIRFLKKYYPAGKAEGQTPGGEPADEVKTAKKKKPSAVKKKPAAKKKKNTGLKKAVKKK